MKDSDMSQKSTAILVAAGVALAAEVIRAIKDGASDEEIRKRLAEPSGVAQDLIDAIRVRESKFAFPGST